MHLGRKGGRLVFVGLGWGEEKGGKGKGNWGDGGWAYDHVCFHFNGNDSVAVDAVFRADIRFAV